MHEPSYASDSPSEFLSRWDRDIQRAARHYCRTGGVTTADVAQEIRLRLFQAWKVHGGEPPLGYVRRTIRNAALNAVRDQGRLVRFGLRDEMAEGTTSGVPRAERDLDVVEDCRRVADWVRSLPGNLKQVLDLLYWRGLSQREAAAVMAVSQPRIAQVHRALLDRGRDVLAI